MKIGIPFWKKETGNLMNAQPGLTEDQIDFLKSLKVGDRLIIWREHEKRSDSHPDYRLKFYVKKEDRL